ncbi:MAG: N-acetylmuramoyl-L-alanine amidase [Candidatus Rickettsia vulgarisii]
MIIDNTTYKAPSFNERVKSLVLHYTERNLETSLKLLLGQNVSVHYLVSDIKPYPIFQLVDESKRAWHAGESCWQGRHNLNDTSIGIEIVNLGYKNNLDGNIQWYPYPEEQIGIVTDAKIIINNYNIHPTCVIGHSDIIPGRKVDPGPLFSWKTLYDNGIGAWYDDKDLADTKKSVDLSNILSIQENFNKYGYNLIPTGIIDQQTTDVIKSFQMHFRPEDYSGKLDAETVAILEALLKKYNKDH